MEKYGRGRHATDDSIARRNTHTLRICNTYCFRRQQWLRERASMLRYTYFACRVSSQF